MEIFKGEIKLLKKLIQVSKGKFTKKRKKRKRRNRKEREEKRKEKRETKRRKGNVFNDTVAVIITSRRKSFS